MPTPDWPLKAVAGGYSFHDRAPKPCLGQPIHRRGVRLPQVAVACPMQDYTQALGAVSEQANVSCLGGAAAMAQVAERRRQPAGHHQCGYLHTR